MADHGTLGTFVPTAHVDRLGDLLELLADPATGAETLDELRAQADELLADVIEPARLRALVSPGERVAVPLRPSSPSDDVRDELATATVLRVLDDLSGRYGRDGAATAVLAIVSRRLADA